MIDLRSDTVTQPSAGMRAAMVDAPVGDDVYGEDPTVAALEARVAALFGHEAAVFVPSGTMGNQICLRLLVPPAGELVCDSDAHIVTYEGGGAAEHGSIQTRTIPGPELYVEAYARAIRPAGWGTVATSAVAVEQTHNRGGGLVHPLAELQRLRDVTAAQGMALHCDGARIWNACVATGVSPAQYGALFDSLSVCLSKGLGAPVGSLVVTTTERAEVARVLRRRLGGGMRQAGILAAAGDYALTHNVERLAADHAHAKALAAAAGADPKGVHTNITALQVTDARAFAAIMREEGVLVSVVGKQRIRLVTSLAVDEKGIEHASTLLRKHRDLIHTA